MVDFVFYYTVPFAPWYYQQYKVLDRYFIERLKSPINLTHEGWYFLSEDLAFLWAAMLLLSQMVILYQIFGYPIENDALCYNLQVFL